jgi:hypothetical protein
LLSAHPRPPLIRVALGWPVPLGAGGVEDEAKIEDHAEGNRSDSYFHCSDRWIFLFRRCCGKTHTGLAGAAAAALKDMSKKGDAIEVVVQGGDLVVTLPKARFKAVYYKPARQPQLILRERTKTDDHELLAEAWKAANEKVRELGWIV